jgi:hypothetical protein
MEDIAYGKIISYTNVRKIKTTGKYLSKTKCKWETNLSGDTAPRVVSWKLKCKMWKWIESRNSNGAVLVV